MQKVSPFLWFDTEAEVAAEFYVSLFDGSHVTSVSRMPDGSAFGVSFLLDGVEFQAMNAGPHFSFTEAVSMFVRADTQPEIDRLWDALIADGGAPSRCGWLKDRWGLSWQIVPAVLGEVLGGADPDGAARAMQAMRTMDKLVIAELQAAYDGV